MADDDKTMVEVEDTQTPDDNQKGASPIKKYGIYAAIVVVMIFAAYFLTLKVVKPMMSGNATSGEQVEGAESAEVEDQHEAEPEEESSGHGSGDESDSHSAAAGGSAGDIFMIRDLIVNPAGTGGTRFLSASIGFEMETGNAASVLMEREAIVRDALITILSSQSIPELSDFRQRERLRKLIKLRVRKLLKTDDITAVYFTEFVLQ